MQATHINESHGSLLQVLGTAMQFGYGPAHTLCTARTTPPMRCRPKAHMGGAPPWQATRQPLTNAVPHTLIRNGIARQVNGQASEPRGSAQLHHVGRAGQSDVASAEVKGEVAHGRGPSQALGEEGGPGVGDVRVTEGQLEAPERWAGPKGGEAACTAVTHLQMRRTRGDVPRPDLKGVSPRGRQVRMWSTEGAMHVPHTRVAATLKICEICDACRLGPVCWACKRIPLYTERHGLRGGMRYASGVFHALQIQRRPFPSSRRRLPSNCCGSLCNRRLIVHLNNARTCFLYTKKRPDPTTFPRLKTLC